MLSKRRNNGAKKLTYRPLYKITELNIEHKQASGKVELEMLIEFSKKNIFNVVPAVLVIERLIDRRYLYACRALCF